MNAQEREHWDHEAGCATELQNCLSEAELKVCEINGATDAKVARAHALGLFVVVRTHP